MKIKITRRILLVARMVGKEIGYGSCLELHTQRSYASGVGDGPEKFPRDPFLVVHVRGFRLFGLSVTLRIRDKQFPGVAA